MAGDPTSPAATTVNDPASGFSDATASVRDTARWLVAGLAAIGAALAAGAQLTSLGSVTELFRLAIAAGAIAVGLVGLVVAIAATVHLLLPERLDLQSIAADLQPAGAKKYIDDHAVELLEGQADNVSQFKDTYYEAIRDRAAAVNAQAEDQASSAKRTTVAELDARVIYLNAVARKVVAGANYWRLRKNLRGWEAWTLGSSLVVALAIAVFAWAANPPKDGTASIELRGANLTGADLRGADLSNADLAGANLTRVVLTNARMDGARLDGIIWNNTICPDGANSDAVGNTCAGHLK